MSSVLTVNIEAPNGLMFEETQIPVDYTVQQLIDELVGSLGLPRIADDGAKIEYSLYYIDKNMKLMPNQLFGQMGLKDGETLRLSASHKIDAADQPVGFQNQQPSNSDEIRVVLSVLDLNRHETTDLSATRPVGELIHQIVDNYELPPRDKLGQPIKYMLQSKALGRFLEETITLRGANIPTGDRLTLHREEIAGGYLWGTTLVRHVSG
jgi:hypothetical protein